MAPALRWICKMGCSETATFTIQNQRIFPDVKICSWFFPDVKLYSWFLVFALISQSSNSAPIKPNVIIGDDVDPFLNCLCWEDFLLSPHTQPSHF